MSDKVKFRVTMKTRMQTVALDRDLYVIWDDGSIFVLKASDQIEIPSEHFYSMKPENDS